MRVEITHSPDGTSAIATIDARHRHQDIVPLLASLNHPHIAQIYGLEEITGTTTGTRTSNRAW